MVTQSKKWVHINVYCELSGFLTAQSWKNT